VLTTYRSFAAIGTLSLVSACTTIEEPERSGFLSTYENLALVSDNHLSFAGDKPDQYSGFIVDKPILLFTPDEDKPKFTTKELEDLVTFFHDAIAKALSKDNNNGAGFLIVTEPGDGVARVRVGINDVQQTVGALNIVIYTKITGAGLGGVAAEGELIDSLTGEQIAAAVRWGTGSRLLRAGFTHTGDAKIAINHWTRDLRRYIDAANGRTE